MLQAVAIGEHTAHGGTAALLRTAQCLVFECGDATGLVAWRWILAHRLAMRQEVLLEVVDELHGLLEELRCLAAVHENGLGAKHFRHLGKDARSALRHQPVAELTHEGVGGDAREAVAAATLQTDAQLAGRHLSAFIGSCLPVEFAQDGSTLSHLVAADTLCHQQFYTIVVVVAQHSHEVFRLVVLAAQ